MNEFIDRLPEDTRQRMFAVMREIDTEMMRYHALAQKLEPPYGTIAVGAAHFDEWMKAYARETYLRHLRRVNPKQAEVNTRIELKQAVLIHNAKRPKDVSWQRWTETAFDTVSALRRRIERITRPQ